jgi:hypothetical protein
MGALGWAAGQRGSEAAGQSEPDRLSDLDSTAVVRQVVQQFSHPESGHDCRCSGATLPRRPAAPLSSRPAVFLGHYGVAFALKRAEPKLSLGTLFLAAQLLDLLWGIFLLLGWEHARIVAENPPLTQLEFYDYPISHSLIGALAWSMVAAACYYSWPTRDTTRHWQASAIVGVAVFSHYPLDVLVHLPDLPIMGNDSPKLGLGLWNHPVATVVAEILVLGLGLGLYVGLRSKRHPVRVGRLAVLALVLLGGYVASLYSPPPPNMTIVGASVIVLLLLLALVAAWADRRTSPEELEAQHLTPR